MEKELDYSRLRTLMTKVYEFIDTLPDEMDENNGFSMVLVARDVMNGVAGICTLTDERDARESIVQCFDKTLSKSLEGKKDNEEAFDIVNGMSEYLMRLCAMFPELYKNFQEGVEKFKKDNDKN